jgi:hypothetical protein
MEEVKATIKNETSKDPEEAALKEFATQLKARHMTPEAFYRLCDGAYKQSISTNHFKKQMRSLGLKLQETQMSRLCLIFDEDLEDSITYQEYQDALEAFGLNKEPHVATDKNQKYVPFRTRVMKYFLDLMEKRDYDARSLYAECNKDGNDCINLKELIDLIK